MITKRIWLFCLFAGLLSLIITGCPIDGSSDDGNGDANGDANHDPVLSAGGVTPTTGDSTTEFTYSVTYADEDGDSPESIEVYVDDTGHSLTLESGTAGDGVYSYTTTLSEGTHSCYFVCSDGHDGSARLPETGAMSEPTVSASANTVPTLSNVSFDPATGDYTTAFTFTADYEDADGDEPAYIQVVIDDTPADMTLASGDAANGSYDYSAVLLAGPHDYYVSCSDGNGGTARVPESGTLSGPFVNGRSLTGTVTYTGGATLGASQPLRVDVWSDASTVIASEVFETSPGDFDFELNPDIYAVSALVDMDASGGRSFGDIFVLYDDTYQLHDPGAVDLTSTDQDIAITLTDDNVFGFMEDFEDGSADGWLEEPADQWTASSGLYYMTGTHIDDLTLAVFDDDTLTDFTFRCDSLDLDSGSSADADWGIIVRFDLVTLSGYLISLETSGDWGLYRIDSESPTPLHGESTFTEGDAVTVSCVGDTIEVYINDALEWTETDSTYTSGHVGFYAWDDTAPASGGPQVFAFGDTWLVLH